METEKIIISNEIKSNANLKICYYDFLPELETLATESFMLT
jgi:hypothetical protein